MIDVSEYMWKLDMLRLWINNQIAFSTVCYDTMRLFDETGHLFSLYDGTESFEDFLYYASLNFKRLTV